MTSSHSVSRFRAAGAALAIATIAAMPAPPAHAQESAEEPRLEEVTVTARKREESVQDVPISITDWRWSVRSEVSYTGKAWDSTANIVKTDDFYRANLRLAFERDDLGVELFVTNLFDDDNWDYIYRTSVPDPRNATQTILPLGNAGVPQGFAGIAPEKREIGLRVKYGF